ncbi:MAG: flagellar filament protein FlaA, partial [Spirochaetes bacterium]
IKQLDYHYANKMGIKVEGFRVDCDPEETLGSYFFYLDDLRAVTDLFAEESRDVDDMMDNW